MKSIARRFNRIQKKYNSWSTNTCFAMSVLSQNFSRQTISRGFNKLVEKSDYDKKDKKTITAFHFRLTKLAEETQKSNQLPVLRVSFCKRDGLDLKPLPRLLISQNT